MANPLKNSFSPSESCSENDNCNSFIQCCESEYNGDNETILFSEYNSGCDEPLYNEIGNDMVSLIDHEYNGDNEIILFSEYPSDCGEPLCNEIDDDMISLIECSNEYESNGDNETILFDEYSSTENQNMVQHDHNYACQNNDDELITIMDMDSKHIIYEVCYFTNNCIVWIRMIINV